MLFRGALNQGMGAVLAERWRGIKLEETTAGGWRASADCHVLHGGDIQASTLSHQPPIGPTRIDQASWRSSSPSSCHLSSCFGCVMPLSLASSASLGGTSTPCGRSISVTSPWDGEPTRKAVDKMRRRTVVRELFLAPLVIHNVEHHPTVHEAHKPRVGTHRGRTLAASTPSGRKGKTTFFFCLLRATTKPAGPDVLPSPYSPKQPSPKKKKSGVPGANLNVLDGRTLQGRGAAALATRRGGRGKRKTCLPWTP